MDSQEKNSRATVQEIGQNPGYNGSMSPPPPFSAQNPPHQQSYGYDQQQPQMTSAQPTGPPQQPQMAYTQPEQNQMAYAQPGQNQMAHAQPGQTQMAYAQPGQTQMAYAQPGQTQMAYAQPGQTQMLYAQPGQTQGQPMMPTGQSQQFLRAIAIPNLGMGAAPVDCPNCGQRAMTSISYHAGNTTHVWAAITFCLTWCLCFIPYMMNSLKNVQHRCGNCGTLLATWHKSGQVEAHSHA